MLIRIHVFWLAQKIGLRMPLMVKIYVLVQATFI